MSKQVLSVIPKGIIRNTPDKACEDGSLLEAINLRFKDGGWRGTGDKEETGYSLTSADVIDSIYHHPVLPANYYITHNSVDNHVYLVSFTDGDPAQTVTSILSISGTFDHFSHLGNTLIVWCTDTKYLLYWNKDTSAYVDITSIPIPVIQISEDPDFEGNELDAIKELEMPDPMPEYGYTDELNTLEYVRQILIGEALKLKSQFADSGYVEGYVAIRVAYKLFDGNYILHSQPYLLHVGYHPTEQPQLSLSTSDPGPPATFTYHINQLYYSQPILYWNYFNTDFNLADHRAVGMIDSLDVFCTRVIPAYDIEAKMDKWTYVSGSMPYVVYYPPMNTEQINKLAEDGQYYKVASIPIDDIIEQKDHYGASGNYYWKQAWGKNLIMPKSIESGQLLPPDNFSHHNILSDNDYQYNSRLNIGNITTVVSPALNNLFHSLQLGLQPDHTYNGFEYKDDLIMIDADIQTKYVGNYTTEEGIANTVIKIYQQAWIKTTDGLKVITTELPQSYVDTFDADNIPATFKYFGYSYSDPTTHYAIILNPLIAYPDYRATKLRFYYTYGAQRFFLADYALKPNHALNIAYYLPDLVTDDNSNGNFYPNVLALPDDAAHGTVMPSDDITADNDTITDSNRMQCSGIVNPLYWDAINSYRFGQPENEIIAIAGVQSAMSDNAFGRYPLYIFTTSGIYTISTGDGDVLYSNIQPLNNEILLSKNTLKGISGGIVYGTKDGLKIITGSQVIELSQPVEGKITNPLSGDTHFYDALTALNLPQVYNYLTNAEFLTYLNGAKIFWDESNKEIIISNPALSVKTSTIIKTTTLNAGGSGYAQNDTFTIDGGTTLATGRVLTVNTGAVDTYEITSPGVGYSVANAVATTKTIGSGTGFKVNITALLPYSEHTYNYSYVYNLQTKTWTTRTEVFDDEMIISGRAIGIKSAYSLATLATVYTHELAYLDSESTPNDYCFIQTRPMNLGTILPKRVDRMVLRSLFDVTDGDYAVALVYGSNDLTNWNVITYQQIIEGGDVYLTRLMGNYKWFIFVFACERNDAIIQLLDVLLQVRFSNIMK